MYAEKAVTIEVLEITGAQVRLLITFSGGHTICRWYNVNDKQILSLALRPSSYSAHPVL